MPSAVTPSARCKRKTNTFKEARQAARDIEFESMQKVADLRELIEQFAATLPKRRTDATCALRWLAGTFFIEDRG